MISFNLKCSNEHVFEAWFKSSSAYEEQVTAGKISCPICGDTKVEKAPMAPRVNMGKSREPKNNVTPTTMRQLIRKLHKHVVDHTEDVGDKFVEEARRIHYGEAEERDIRGKATEDEVKELADEDINVYRLPNLPRSDA